MSLISVQEARRRVLADTPVLPAENVPLPASAGRVLAADLYAERDQPPFAASAMDGYAVRAADVRTVPVDLEIIGEAPAGRAFSGRVGPGQAVRIFTGAPVPAGADGVVIQENAARKGDVVSVMETAAEGKFVRPAGMDFRAGDLLLANQIILGASELALMAAMNRPVVPVRRRPVVAIVATGDELVLPGEAPAADQIIASNTYGLAAAVHEAGGIAVDLGIAADHRDALNEAIDGAIAAEADILVTSGGASVGDHDLVKDTLQKRGMTIGFWTIAMRPGKPMMFGSLNSMKMLGFPGNPVSSMVAAQVFLKPLIRQFLGRSGALDIRRGVCGEAVPANDRREEFMRAIAEPGPDGRTVVTPYRRQDSSMLRLFQQANALLIRPAHDPGIAAGDQIDYLPLSSTA